MPLQVTDNGQRATGNGQRATGNGIVVARRSKVRRPKLTEPRR
jgi:hypothetical protein